MQFGLLQILFTFAGKILVQFVLYVFPHTKSIRNVLISNFFNLIVLMLKHNDTLTSLLICFM